MLTVILGVVVFVLGYLLGLYTKNKDIHIKITHENIVDYKNFPQPVKEDIKDQLKQAQETAKVMEQAQKVLSDNGANNQVDRLYDEFMRGDR